jgi:hypothetical protein
MRLPFQCKCGGSDFAVGDCHKIIKASFLWMTWMRKVHSGYMAVCVRRDCGMPWVVSLTGSSPVVPAAGAQSERRPKEPTLSPEEAVAADDYMQSDEFAALPSALRNAFKRGVSTRERVASDPLADAIRRPVV